MPIDKFQGKWDGSYKYGPEYPEKYHNRIEPFSLEIEFDGNNFRGTCIDNFTKTLFHQPAIVEGTFAPDYISFIKKYPCLLTVDENGNAIFIADQPSLDIHYTGHLYKSLFSKTYRFEGEWVITNFLINDDGEKKFYTLYGSWEMKKVN